MSRHGMSLVELLVAVVILEVAIVSAIGAVIMVERVRRSTLAGASVDAARWSAWQAAERSAACRAGAAAAAPFTLPSSPERSALHATLACGR